MTGRTRRSGQKTTKAAAPLPAKPGGLEGRTRRILAPLAWGPAGARPPAARWAASILALAGAALIVVSAIIHLRLWANGYRGIAVIGPLFLAQGVASIILAVALALFRRLGLLVAGAALMATTAIGLLLSVHVALFGFRDSLAAPDAGLSLVVEFAATGLLLAGAVLIAAPRAASAGRSRSRGPG
jgi:hypothetical protein